MADEARSGQSSLLPTGAGTARRTPDAPRFRHLLRTEPGRPTADPVVFRPRDLVHRGNSGRTHRWAHLARLRLCLAPQELPARGPAPDNDLGGCGRRLRTRPADGPALANQSSTAPGEPLTA